MKNMYKQLISGRNIMGEIRDIAACNGDDYTKELEEAEIIYHRMNNGATYMATIGLTDIGSMFAAGTAGFGIATAKISKMNPVSFVLGLSILGTAVIINRSTRRESERDLRKMLAESDIDPTIPLEEACAEYLDECIDKLSEILARIYECEDIIDYDDCSQDIQDEMDHEETKEEPEGEPEIAGEIEAQPEPHEPNAFEVFEEARKDEEVLKEEPKPDTFDVVEETNEAVITNEP